MKKKKSCQEHTKDQKRLYGDLAWTWPIISPPKDYIEESEHIKKLILHNSKIPVKTLLNLGCGGGHVDSVLKKYFKITGVDVSKNMLALAKKLNPQATYVRGDMRRIRLKTTFDAVLIHDSINYMLTKRELKAAFKTAFVHLNPGGIFCTFVEEYDKLRQSRVHFSTHRKGNVEITFIEHYYDSNPRDTTYEATFIYLIRRNRKLTIHTDRHLGGIFKLSTWLKILRELGFKVKVSKFTHSQFPKGKSFPELICLKPVYKGVPRLTHST